MYLQDVLEVESAGLAGKLDGEGGGLEENQEQFLYFVFIDKMGTS